ncbi:MAG TPA: hypothetical protein VN131_03290 [Mobilitalea sp.]|nr:hypothetical protein [Mobilitalea sp.]
MSESFGDMIVILFCVILPIIFALLQIFLSTRKHLVLAVVIPFIWSALGGWMMIVRYQMDREFSSALFIFFLCGDIILAGITLLVRLFLQKRRSSLLKEG